MSDPRFSRVAFMPPMLERALQRYRISRQFRQHLGYDGNFENPANYNEKVQFRKLYGNHEFYARVADKYRARDYVRERIGPQYLKPLLGVFDSLTAEILESLPRPYIVKANNGCRWHRVVTAQGNPDWDAIVRYFDGLENCRFGRGTGELHYDYIPFKILAEPLLQESDGGLPWDYDIWCFKTPAGFQHVQSIISPRGEMMAFDAEWNFLQGTLAQHEVEARINPPQFPQMLSLARTLSADFDFVRVDFTLVGGRIYFGELTCTPGQGYTQITSPRRMKLLTELWHLDSLNPNLYRAPRSHRPRTAARPTPARAHA